jgi:hypothetical protein
VSSSSCTWALPSSPAIPALSPRRRVRAKLPPSTSCPACERLWLQSRPVHDRKWPVAWRARRDSNLQPSVDTRVGVQTRSRQSVASDASLAVIHASPIPSDLFVPVAPGVAPGQARSRLRRPPA